MVSRILRHHQIYVVTGGVKVKGIKNIKLTVFCLLLIFIFTGTGVFAQEIKQMEALPTPFKIFLNCEELSFNTPVVTINGSTYVPLREFGESYLGMEVEWNGSEKRIDLKNELRKDDDMMISMTIVPMSETISYRVDISFDGQYQLASTVGMATASVFPDTVVAKGFTPIITRYKNLTCLEMEELVNLTSKITIDEKGDGQATFGGWYVIITYQGKTRSYVFAEKETYWLGSNHMFKIVEKLIEYSPIEIVAFNYEDWRQRQYYENFDW